MNDGEAFWVCMLQEGCMWLKHWLLLLFPVSWNWGMTLITGLRPSAWRYPIISAAAGRKGEHAVLPQLELSHTPPVLCRHALKCYNLWQTSKCWATGQTNMLPPPTPPRSWLRRPSGPSGAGYDSVTAEGLSAFCLPLHSELLIPAHHSSLSVNASPAPTQKSLFVFLRLQAERSLTQNWELFSSHFGNIYLLCWLRSIIMIIVCDVWCWVFSIDVTVNVLLLHIWRQSCTSQRHIFVK